MPAGEPRFVTRGAARLAENAPEHGNRINRVMLIGISSLARIRGLLRNRVAARLIAHSCILLPECRVRVLPRVESVSIESSGAIRGEFSAWGICFPSYDGYLRHVRHWEFFFPS